MGQRHTPAQALCRRAVARVCLAQINRSGRVHTQHVEHVQQRQAEKLRQRQAADDEVVARGLQLWDRRRVGYRAARETGARRTQPATATPPPPIPPPPPPPPPPPRPADTP